MKNTVLKLASAGAIVASALAVIGSSSASATSSPATCSSSLVTTSKTPIKLTFWEGMPEGITGKTKSGADTGNEEAILNLVKAFNTAEKGKIVVTDINQSGGYTQTWTNYVSSLSNGTSPNVVMFDQYDAQAAADSLYNDHGKGAPSILPVSTCISANKTKTSAFSAKELGSYTVGKTIWGMPFSASVPVMYYNEQAFTQAGIKSPPTTMTELIADQKLLEKASWKNSKGTKVYYANGVSIQYDPWEITSWLGLANQMVVNNSNGHAKRATASSFGNNATLQTYLTDLQTIAKDATTPGANVSNPNAGTLAGDYANLFDVANGVSGITFDTTAALGTIQDYLGLYPNVTLGVAPLPTLTGKVTGGMPSGGNGLFINASNSSAAQEAAAYQFVSFMTSASNLATWDAATGYLPIRSDEVTAWKNLLAKQTTKTRPVSTWYQVGYKELSSGKATPATEGLLVGAYNQVNSDMATALESLLTSPFNTTPKEALNTAAANVTTDIQYYNSINGY